MSDRKTKPWFKVGQRVIVSGAGVGEVVEVGDLRYSKSEGYEGYRDYRVNFGESFCRTCHQSTWDRIEWAQAIHMGLTVDEQKQLDRKKKMQA